MPDVVPHLRLTHAAALRILAAGIAKASAMASRNASRSSLAEWITGSRGLGLVILESGDLREVELLWAAVVLAVLIALAVFWTTSAAERAFLHWRH